MKYALVTLTLLISTWQVRAQVPTIQWAKSFGGSLAEDCQSIKQTSDGGYVAAGQTLSNDGDVTVTYGGGDLWVVKLDSLGSIQWQKSLGGSSGECAGSINTVSGGGYIITGFTSSADGDVTGHHAGQDVWVIRMDDTGAVMWKKCYGGSNNDFGNSVCQTFDGGFVVAGYSFSSDGDVTTNHGMKDYWVLKLNDTGRVEWQKSYGGSLNESASYIQQTRDSGYIVAGESQSTDGDVTGNHGNYDFWILKLSDTGAIQWQKSLGGSRQDIATSMQQTFDEGYIVAGQSFSNDDDVSGNHGLYDFWVVKLNDTGGIQWEQSFGGSNGESATAVSQTADSSYAVFGTSNSSDGYISGSHGGFDYWIVKLSPLGVLQWQKSLGGTGDEFSSSMQPVNNGYVVAGVSDANSDDVSGIHGSSDFWIVKLRCGIDAGTISGVSTLCPGSTTTLSETVTGGAWSVNNGHATITGGVVSGISTGVDIVTYSVSTSCGTATTTFPVTINPCPTVVAEPTEIERLVISPNPTSDAFNISGARDNLIKVYNFRGELIMEKTGKTAISLSDYPTGLYLIRVFNTQGILITQEKLVKR